VTSEKDTTTPPHGDELAEALPDAPEVVESEIVEPEAPQDGASGDLAAEFRDKYLRAEAELQNVRRRAARDVAAAQDRGVAKLARELLTAFDHLEVALRSAEEHEAGEWVKGIRLVGDELTAALARAGIQAFSPEGEPFDPNEHEAMAQQPSGEEEAGTVLQVYQQGYRLNGQVLRPARVVVAGGPA
jgi:molecular chaperone GrpE